MDTKYTRKAYENPKIVGSLRGISGFLQNRKSKSKEQSKLVNAIKNVDTYSLFKPNRVHFPSRRMIVQNRLQFFACDLSEFTKSQMYLNSHFKFLLVFLDAFSKKTWLRPLKSKSGEEVSKAFESILKPLKLTAPSFMNVDRGREFYNEQVTAVLSKYKVTAYSTFSAKKSFLAENKIRFIKRILERLYFSTGKKQWVSFIPTLEKNLNDSYHRSIGMTPNQADKPQMQSEVFHNLYNDLFMAPIKRAKLKVGDLVRVANQRKTGIFQKKYKESYSRDLYTVHQIKNTFPISYQLKDSSGKIYPGSWMELELQKNDGQ